MVWLLVVLVEWWRECECCGVGVGGRIVGVLDTDDGGIVDVGVGIGVEGKRKVLLQNY